MRCGTGFATLRLAGARPRSSRTSRTWAVARWHRLVAAHVWSLWTPLRTAFYAHPWAWEEIGFGGPAYPRGYKNLGIDRREPYEVRDAHPGNDPTTDSVG